MSAPPVPPERPLVRKSSRLSKQAEVEAEDPPEGQNHQKKIVIPETRIESFDVLVPDSDPSQSPPSKSKVLVRSHALCGDDDTKLNTRGIEKQGSSKSGSAGSSLSRDSSNEIYRDSTGINLEEFIANTLHKNAKDRQMLLKLEEELCRFINDNCKQALKFPPMSSYNRMLVHRVSAFFGLDHNVDQSGGAVVVNKTKTTRIPDLSFEKYIRSDCFTEEPRRLGVRRDVQSYEEVRGDPYFGERKTRSFEERDDDKERARTRFYNQDSSSSVEIMESPIRVLFSGYSSGSTGGTSARPWSSTDSSSLDVPPPHPPLSFAAQKAGSFGGVPTFYPRDITRIPPKRSNTDAAKGGVVEMTPPAAMLSGSRPAFIPETPPIVGGALPGQQVIFAVASWDQVPPGAILINPATGQPYVNSDGSMHRHMSQYSSPPAGYIPQSFVQDPSILCGGMQSMSLQVSPPQPPHIATRSLNHPYPVVSSPQQVLAYMMSPQNTGAETTCSTPQPPQQSVMVQLPPYPSGSVQYQSSVQYVLPPAQVVYTQATVHSADTTQVTYTQSSSGGVEPYVMYGQGSNMYVVLPSAPGDNTHDKPVPSSTDDGLGEDIDSTEQSTQEASSSTVPDA